MHGFAASPVGIAVQIALSLLLIVAVVYPARGWMERQDSRQITPTPVWFFLGQYVWKPVVWIGFLLAMTPVYQTYHLWILAITHAVVTAAFWVHRMLTCGQWRAY